MSITDTATLEYIDNLFDSHSDEFIINVDIYDVSYNNGKFSLSPGSEFMEWDERKLLIQLDTDNYFGFLLVDADDKKTAEIITFRGTLLPGNFESLIKDLSINVTITPKITPYLANDIERLYYLESALINNPTPKDIFINKITEIIRADQEDYDFYVKYHFEAKSPLKYPFQPVSHPPNTPLKGVLLCHGHAHTPPIIPLTDDVEWTMVDISPASKPDIIGGFGSMETLQQLGLYQWDYVMSYYCPANDSSLYRGARYLLNNKGKFIANNLDEFSDAELGKIKTDNYYKDVRTEGKYTIFDV